MSYRRLLRWAALPVTDRRWAAPLCAVALGFGLFAGVAIGPGAAGTLATGAAPIIELPSLGGGAESSGEGGGGGGGSSPRTAGTAGEAAGGGGRASSESPSALSSFLPGEFGGEPTEAPESFSPPTESAPPTERPEPEEQTLTGVVLHVNLAAGSYTLAEPEGALDVVHAAKAPRPGAKLRLPFRTLANGTLAEAGQRKTVGQRSRAAFEGIVTYVDPTPATPAYTVSKRGVSVLVHVHPDPAGAAPTLPALGAFAKVTVDIEKPGPPVPTSEPETPAPEPNPAPAIPACSPDPSQPPRSEIQPEAVLWQRQLSAEGAPFTYSDFEGIVQAVCPDSGQLLVSADDVDESRYGLAFGVPAAIDIAGIEVGQSIAATASIGADGSLSLTGLASDEHSRGADDEGALQGDLAQP